MLNKSIAAAALIAGAVFLPGAAQAATGYTVGSAEMRAGPDYDYPTVRVIRDGRRVNIYGCLTDWSFCDVGYRSDRGWVEGNHLMVDYRNRRTTLVVGAPFIGIGVLTFSFGNYWDSYYRGRPFYTERGRWEQHYNDHYQPHWGPRPDHRDSNDRDRRDNDRGTPDRGQQDNNRTRDAQPDRSVVAPAKPQPQPQPAPPDHNAGRRDHNAPQAVKPPEHKEIERQQVAPQPRTQPMAPQGADKSRNAPPAATERHDARPQPAAPQQHEDKPAKPKKNPDDADNERDRPGH